MMPTFWTFAISLVLIGFSAVTLLTTANGYVQTTTSADVRGRVMAIYMAILMGGTPLGAPIVGWVANTLGPRWGLGVAAVAGVLACAIAIGWLVVAHQLRIRVKPDSTWRLMVTHDGQRDEAAEAAAQEAAEQERFRPIVPVPTTTMPIAVVSENPPTGAIRLPKDRRIVPQQPGGNAAAQTPSSVPEPRTEAAPTDSSRSPGPQEPDERSNA